MLRFMLQKLMHKKGLVFSLLIGNILLIAIASSHAMYKNASLQRMLTDEFTKVVEETNTHPAMFTFTYNVKKLTPTNDFWYTKDMIENLCSSINVPEQIVVNNYYISASNAVPKLALTTNSSKSIQIASLTDFDAHSQIVSGRAFSSELTSEGHFEAVISESTLINMNLIVGDTLEFTQLMDANGNTIKVDIVGVFKNTDDTDPYWVKAPSQYNNVCFISPDLFFENFVAPMEGGAESNYFMGANWYVQMDYTKFSPDMSDNIIQHTNRLIETYPNVASATVKFETTDHIAILEGFKLTQSQITATLIILEAPVLALLCAFLFMISTQLIQLEENEISQLKSRGASRVQIFFLYLLQSSLLAGLGIVGGIPLGSFLCQALGSANAFLEFVQRTPLEISITSEVLIFVAGAALLSVLMTVLPALKHSKLSIVDAKRKRTRRPAPLWQKLFLDVIMLAVSIYGYYTFNKQRDNLYLRVLAGESLDPLLFLSSSLFILGLGLLCLRLQPLLVKLIYTLGKKFWKPANFTSLLQIIRTGSKQHFIMAFMIFTVSLGIFFATVARTVLTNAENNTTYSLGADLIIQERWSDNSALLEENPGLELVFYEPDINRYVDMPEVESVAKVLRKDMTFRTADHSRIHVDLLAVNTKDFGNTIYMPDNLLVTHINNYLNVLSQVADGVLLSQNFKDVMGYSVGDTITLSLGGTSFVATIVGFFDYWPGYLPSVTTINPDGTPASAENYLAIANYATVLSKWDITPYEIWIKLADDVDTDFIYNFAEENDIRYTKFTDLSAEVVKIHNETLFQGTNGILTMSFIVILVLYAIGFLIYWILSIKSRELLFGVLRAMGMSRAEIIHMLVNEQLFTGVLSIVLGCVIGFIVSNLFVPLIQIAYSTGAQALPLELITDTNDMVKLFAIIGITFVFCMAILTRIVFSMKITQALKLGED
ncbi:MAG: ABC transporter permease [Lachnospiraceae bacterium]|nr:ABC transporter permease [Lachnospiraceae bacterium]